MLNDPFHNRLLEIVLRLPGAYEDRPWGSVHCKVAGKIFVGWGRRGDGEMELGFRTDLELQSMLVASDPRFTIAKYVGQYGGVDMRLGTAPNWDEVEHFIVESYRRIAPKKLVKELDAQDGAAGLAVAAKPAGKSAAAAKKTAAAKKMVAVKKSSTAKKTVAKSPAKQASATKKTATKKTATKKPAAKKPAAKKPATRK